MAELTVADIMTREVLTATPATPIHEVARLMATEHISGVPVVERDGSLVGIVTEGDLIAAHAGGDQSESWWLALLAEGGDLSPEYLDFLRAQRHAVRTVMKTDLVTTAEEAGTADIARLMVSKGINRLPVVKDGHLVGIVTRGDLVRALSMRPTAEDARGFVDQTHIGRATDHPVLDSGKLEKPEEADHEQARRRAQRPLFP